MTRKFNDGRLYLNDSERLEHVREVDDGVEYRDYWTSGEGIEIRVSGTWLRGRIEYDHDAACYYFVSEQDVLMNLVGVMARRPPRGARA